MYLELKQQLFSPLTIFSFFSSLNYLFQHISQVITSSLGAELFIFIILHPSSTNFYQPHV